MFWRRRKKPLSGVEVILDYAGTRPFARLGDGATLREANFVKVWMQTLQKGAKATIDPH